MGLFSPSAAKIRDRFKARLEERQVYNRVCRLGQTRAEMVDGARSSTVDMVAESISNRLLAAGGFAAVLGTTLLMAPYALQVNSQNWIAEQALKMHAAMPDVSRQALMTMVTKAHPFVEALANLNHTHVVAGGIYASLALLPASAGMLMAAKASFDKTAERRVAKALDGKAAPQDHSPEADTDAIAPAV